MRVSWTGWEPIICDDAQKQNWFYFSISNAQYQSFSMKFINADANSNQTSWWTEFRPVYSYDRVTWTRIAATGSLNGVDYDYTAPGGGATFTSDTVYIAFTIPYTYSDYTADLAEWDASDLVSYVDIGDSVQGREMDLVTVADTSSPIAAADKKVYWIIGRQHSTETAGSISIDGVIRFLIGGSDEAKLMLRSSIFKLIPMMNPDGAYNGWTRTNAQRCDINREWESTGANATTETAEIYNAHTAIEDWMTNGTPNTVDVFSDYHHLTSSEMSLVYDGDATMVGASDNPYEKIFGWLDPNTHTSNFTASGTTGLFNVAIYDQYNASKGSLSFTVEHAGIKFSNGWPTNENIRAYGLAWLKTMFSVNESDAKIFGMEPPDGGSGTDSRFYVVTSPGQMTLSFDEDAGGGMTHWFDLENDPNMLQELAESTLRNVDEVSWHDGTDWRLTSTTSNATLAVISNSGNRLRFKYTGVWEAVSGYDYEHERVMWGNGISWQSFKFTNNTAGSINWGNMYMQASVENLLASSFAFDYDNTADPPTPGTDNWFGIVGNGTAGIKAVVMAYPYGQTGGWVYNDYLSASSLSGHRNEYFIIDGPTQGTGAGNAITTYVAYQVGSDNDIVGSEAQIDEYSNYIQNPDTPTMTTGTFTEFDKQEGSLEFGAATNHVTFTYTNADTVTKKSPSYVITDYTASTAPVLNINGAYLDSEDGSAHSGTTHVSASYTASVDTTNDIAYVQYLGDISANQVVMLGDELSYTLTYTAGANGSITGTTPQTVNYGEDGTEVTAVPDANYHFTSWSDGVLTTARTDTNVTDDITVTANFAIDTFTLTYTAGANGTITGTTPQTVNYGADGTEVTAVPATGYHFTSWSDGVLTAARTDTNVTDDITVTASFAINTYTLTYTAGANGSITGTTPQTVNYGADGSEVFAVPDTGYHFTSWSDGVLTAARTDENVTGNISVTASFAINTYTLTYTAGANGSITGTTPQTVNYGADGTEVTAVPDTGYHFTSWSDGVLTTVRTDTNVTANVTVTANFAIDTFTLTYTAGSHGSITGTTPQTVNYGADGSEVTAVPATGYHFTSWSDGVLTAARTDTTIVANLTVTASFAINTYTLTYTAGSHGSITGTTPQTVNYGADGSVVTAVPSTNYHFVDWSDDSTENPRTDTSVTGDVAVTANFAADTQITDVAETNITTSAATITWTTNHDATSLVEYGKTTAYGEEKTSSDAVTEHRLTLTGLSSDTTYHYRVTSVGNTTATSVDGTFTT
ncbi:MAG: M14-type cytosolic carboxypeptidase, partial [Patescibacteria group bacterium]